MKPSKKGEPRSDRSRPLGRTAWLAGERIDGRANRIPSRHVVHVTDFGKLADGRGYSVMEFLEGQSIAELAEKEKPMAPDRALDLVRVVAETMTMAHAHGVIHRDIKPENLFLQRQHDGSEVLRVLDFGIAHVAAELDDSNRTPLGMPLGTPRYCSPEQALGESVGPKTDVYSLGIVAYELLTGTAFVSGRNVVEILMAKVHKEPVRSAAFPHDVPTRVIELVRAMLARDPDKRPTMAEISDALCSQSIFIVAPTATHIAVNLERVLPHAKKGAMGLAIALAYVVSWNGSRYFFEHVLYAPQIIAEAIAENETKPRTSQKAAPTPVPSDASDVTTTEISAEALKTREAVTKPAKESGPVQPIGPERARSRAARNATGGAVQRRPSPKTPPHHHQTSSPPTNGKIVDPFADEQADSTDAGRRAFRTRTSITAGRLARRAPRPPTGARRATGFHAISSATAAITRAETLAARTRQTVSRGSRLAPCTLA